MTRPTQQYDPDIAAHEELCIRVGGMPYVVATRDGAGLIDGIGTQAVCDSPGCASHVFVRKSLDGGGNNFRCQGCGEPYTIRLIDRRIAQDWRRPHLRLVR